MLSNINEVYFQNMKQLSLAWKAVINALFKKQFT